MDDPYKILGVSPDASDEEIKRAYRALAKKYHPDRNPGDQEAAKKMQQINSAYERIKNPEKYTAQQGPDPYEDPFAGFYGYQTQQREPEGDTYQKAAKRYIQYHKFHEALNALKESKQKDARWYYLSAIANYGAGNEVTALEHIKRAVSMEPDNQEYLYTLEQMESGDMDYRRHTGSYRGYQMAGGTCSPLCLCLMMRFCCYC